MNSRQWSLQLSRKTPGFTIVCSGASSLAAVLQASNESSAAQLEYSCDGVNFFSSIFLADFESLKLDQKTNAKLDIRLRGVAKATRVNIFGSSIGNVSIIPTDPIPRNVQFSERLDCNLGDGLYYERLKPGVPGTKWNGCGVARFEINGEVKTIRLKFSQLNEGLELGLRGMLLNEERLVTVPAELNGKDGHAIYKVKFLGN